MTGRCQHKGCSYSKSDDSPIVVARALRMHNTSAHLMPARRRKGPIRKEMHNTVINGNGIIPLNFCPQCGVKLRTAVNE